jgi:hypothetical protein
MNLYTGLTVNGTLIADAEGEDKVYFTTVNDDAIDGIDVTGNGNTVPARNSWSRITFNDSSNDAECLMNNCELIITGLLWLVLGHRLYQRTRLVTVVMG